MPAATLLWLLAVPVVYVVNVVAVVDVVPKGCHGPVDVALLAVDQGRAVQTEAESALLVPEGRQGVAQDKAAAVSLPQSWERTHPNTIVVSFY